MTETPEHDPPLSPEQEAAVRRALAAAGGPESMPDDVAGRLDEVLTGLAADRATAAAGPEGVVVPLDAAARRRRTRARVLVGACAAAAVVAVSFGVLTDRGTEAEVSAGQSAEAPSRSVAASEGPSLLSAPPVEADAQEDQPGPEAGPIAPRRVVTQGAVRSVRPDRLREDLVAVQRATLKPGTDYDQTTLNAPASFMCEDADYGHGFLVGVEYDGKPALVAFREPAGSTQVADVLACGTGELLHSTTLDAR